MPRQSSRSLGCAGDRPSAAPSAPAQSGGISRCRRPFRFAPGRAGPRGCGGAGPAVSVGLKDAPSSPRSSSGRGVGFKVVPTSTVLSTRHEQPCPCTVAVRPRRKLLRASRHRAASPNVSRSMFRVPAEPGILTSSGMGVATPGGHAPRQAVAALGACHGIVLAYPCAASAPSSLRPRQEISVRSAGKARSQGEPCPPPKVGDRLRSLPRGLEIDQERVESTQITIDKLRETEIIKSLLASFINYERLNNQILFDTPPSLDFRSSESDCGSYPQERGYPARSSILQK